MKKKTEINVWLNECRHDNWIEDGYNNCIFCIDCGEYIEHEDFEKIKNINLKEVIG